MMYSILLCTPTTSMDSVQWELPRRDCSLVAAAHGEWSGTGRNSHESRKKKEEECSALRVWMCSDEGREEDSVAVDLSFGRLRQLHVFFAHHESSQLLQDHTDAVGVLPLGQWGHSSHINHTIWVMHSIQVDLRHKANKRGRFWISWSTFYSEAVHPVLIDSPRGSDDHSSPAGEGHVLVVFQTPAHRPISNTLLTLLELLQQPKVTGDFHAWSGGGRHLVAQQRKHHCLTCWYTLTSHIN